MKDIELYKGKLSLERIIKLEEEFISQRALLICDLSDIIQKYKIWQLKLPQVTPFYAVKCNDDPTIIKVLNQLGCGFDCASQSEIFKVRNLGISADRIIYAHPCKPTSHLNFARDNGVYTMTFDGEEELLKIKKHFPSASLLLRIRCDAAKSYFPLGNKFGCDSKLEAINLLQIAKDLNLNVVGVSFHIGSGCQEFGAFKRAIKSSAEILLMGNEMNFNMQILDIGGGFPGANTSEFIDVADIISQAIDNHLPKNNNLKIIAEPGRYFVESAQTLITDIHSKRVVKRNGTIERIMYFLNDGAFGSLHYVLYEHDDVLFSLFEKNDLEKWNKIDINNFPQYKCTIWGPSCDSFDKIIEEVELPNVEIESKFVVYNIGAYALTLSSGFNGFLVPLMKYFIEENDKSILQFNFNDTKLLEFCKAK